MKIDPVGILLARVHHTTEWGFDVGHIAAYQRIAVVTEAFATSAGWVVWARFRADWFVDIEACGNGWGCSVSLVVSVLRSKWWYMCGVDDFIGWWNYRCRKCSWWMGSRSLKGWYCFLEGSGCCCLENRQKNDHVRRPADGIFGLLSKYSIQDIIILNYSIKYTVYN